MFANNHMSMAVGRLFVENHFDVESKKSALHMIATIKQAFTGLCTPNVIISC